ncbi:hypothetical protein [Bacillus sp. FSL K6-1338]
MEELVWSFLKGISFGVGKKAIESLYTNTIKSHFFNDCNRKKSG